MNNGIPSRLYENCLNYLCNNLDLICDLIEINEPFNQTNQKNKHSKQFNKKLVFKDKTIKINHIVSEDILERLCDLGKLNDLTITLFNQTQTCFKNVIIKNASISKESVKVFLKQHHINELLINNIQINSNDSESQNSIDQIANNINHTNQTPITINDLIDGLNSWSLEHLKHLNVSRNITLFGSILINLRQLNNLVKLNVSYTCFNNHSLEIITQDLNHLEYLDISGTRVSDVVALLRLKNLKFLLMYNMRASLTDDIISVVCDLTKLQHLDLSCDLSTKLFSDMSLSLFDVNLLLEQLTKFKLNDLKYLDISGKIEIKRDTLKNFIQAYPNLKFMGLALTNAHSFDFILSILLSQYSSSSQNKYKTYPIRQTDNITSDLIVTGESTEQQLIASLKYYKTRHLYIQKALNRLYILTKSFQETRIDLLLLIIELMLFHNKSQSVQLAATSCIFNLTWQKLNPTIPNYIITQIINTVLTTMQNFPNSFNLQKNCLLMFRNEKLLKNCLFNKYDCVKVSLDCITIYNDQDIISSSAIAICSQVALNAEEKYRVQFKKLAEPKYAQKLVAIINSSIEHLTNDIILYNILDILIGLSDDCSEWCCNLLTQNCLNVCCNLFEIFENDSLVISKSIHLAYNMSQIEQIRPILFSHPISNLVKKLLCHPEMQISFLSVGYFSYLLHYLPENDWDWYGLILKSTTKEIFCNNLLKLKEEIMDNWNEELQLESYLSVYSYKSVLKLISLANEPVIKLWCLWAIENFNQLNGKDNPRIDSNLNEIFVNILRSTESRPKLVKLCTRVLNSIKNISAVLIEIAE